MAAAALGNTISDLLGIGSAWYVESLADKLGELFALNILTTFFLFPIKCLMPLPGARPPDLSPEQLEMRSSRISANLGRAAGDNLQIADRLHIYYYTFIFRNVSTSFY